MAKGKIVEATFGAKRKLEALEELPEPREEGAVTIFSNGKTVSVLICRDGAWEVLGGRWKLDTLVDYLLKRRAHRRRVEAQLACERGHEWDGRRCRRCHARKPAAWSTCGALPFATKEDVLRRTGPDGQRIWRLSNEEFILGSPKCRRRVGHEGPCSWQNGALEHHKARLYERRETSPGAIVISIEELLETGALDLPGENS